MARNAIKITYDDGSEQSIPVIPSPPPPPPSSHIIKGGYFDGIPTDQAGFYAGLFGMTWVRTWFTITDWNQPPTSAMFARNRQLQAQGLRVLTVFTGREATGTQAAGSAPASASQAADWFAKAQLAANGAVDAWEIWNEPNLAQYNGGMAVDIVNRVLKPAAQMLLPTGEMVIGPSWSEKLDGFQQMIDAGYLDNCNAVAYHPYGNNLSEHVSRVQQMRNLIGPETLWLTEWNTHAKWGGSTAEQAAAILVDAAKQIAPLIDAAFYFRLTYTSGGAGNMAPFSAGTTNGSLKRAPYYQSVVDAMGKFG